METVEHPAAGPTLHEQSGEALVRYQAYLQAELGLEPLRAAALAPAEYTSAQAYFLVLGARLLSLDGIDLPSEMKDLIGISAYARFRSVVSLDALLDDGESETRPHVVYEAMIHLEAAVRSAKEAGLSSGRPQRLLHRLAKIYLRTRLVERSAVATEFQLARLLFRKSCMVLLPLAWAVHFGADWRAIARARAAAIKLFVALQLLDDVMDLERDVAGAQNSLLMAHLRRRHPEFTPDAWTIADRRIRVLMAEHLGVAESRALSAVRLYQDLGTPELAHCCRQAARSVQELRDRLRVCDAV